MQPGDMITFMTNGAEAIVVDVRGFNVQTVLNMSAPEFRTVHMDAVLPIVPEWSDEDDTTFVSVAINAMAERNLPLGVFTLARYALRMRAAYIAEKARADGTETALTGEGKALDVVAREREELRRELDECKQALGKHANAAIPLSASIGLLAETLESRTISLSEHIHEHDAVVRELEQAHADLATLNRAHEEALRERDTARSEVNRLHEQIIRMTNDAARRESIAEMSVTTGDVQEAFTAVREASADVRESMDRGVALAGGLATGLAEMARANGSLKCDCVDSTPYAHCLAAMNEDVHVPDPSVDAVLAEHSNGPDSGAIAATGANAWVAQKIDQQYAIGDDVANGAEQIAAFRSAAHAQLAKPVSLSPAAQRVLAYLQAERGSRSAETIRKVVGLGKADWTRARDELVDRSLVVSHGKAKGTTYQVRQ